VTDTKLLPETQLTTQQVADRLGLTTEALSELRLKIDDLPIERDGFRLYYHLETIHAYEKQEIVNVIQRILNNDRPLLILKRMAEASGLANLQIAGQRIQPNKPTTPAPASVPPTAVQQTRLDDTNPWFVVHTKPRQEKTALENLKRQGYACYLPTIKVQKPRGKTLSQTEEPMFPRYLFVAIDQNFRGKGSTSIRSTRGVHELVCFGNEPSPIAFDLLNAIFEREREQHRHPDPPFKNGDRVTVVDGPLAGLESIYQAKTGEERSMILLNLLNRPTKVQINTAQLRKTG
jgi:transcriptional antiterminator RfaH